MIMDIRDERTIVHQYDKPCLRKLVSGVDECFPLLAGLAVVFSEVFAGAPAGVPDEVGDAHILIFRGGVMARGGKMLLEAVEEAV